MRISNDVLDVLKKVKVEGNLTTMPQLDRKLYVKVNEVLVALGGKWDRKQKAHVFDGDPGDRLNDAVTTGEIIDAKKEFQFFETPAGLAKDMVVLLKPDRNHRVLEPSCGRGALIKALLTSGWVEQGQIVAIDRNEEMVAHCLRAFPDVDTVRADFLPYECVGGKPGFDRIIMNPPFRNGQDVDHVMHAYTLLKPGGRLVALTAPGWTFRTDKKHSGFRTWVEFNASVNHEVPAGTFKESGTMIRTQLLVIDKE